MIWIDYQELLNVAELLETLKGLKRALEQMKQGQGKGAEEVFQKFYL